MQTNIRAEHEALRNFNAMPDAAFVRRPVVALLFATSPDNVWRWVKKGVIPEPRKLASKTTAWNVGDLRAALKVAGLS